MTPHPPSGTPAPRCPGVLTNCPSPRALLSWQLTGAEGLGGEAGNRQGAPGWGGKPKEFGAQGTNHTLWQRRHKRRHFCPAPPQPCSRSGAPQPQRGAPSTWRSQSRTRRSPLPSAGRPLRTRSPLPLRSAPPALRRQQPHGAGAARPSAAPGQRALPRPRPPAPAGRPRPRTPRSRCLSRSFRIKVTPLPRRSRGGR